MNQGVSTDAKRHGYYASPGYSKKVVPNQHMISTSLPSPVSTKDEDQNYDDVPPGLEIKTRMTPRELPLMPLFSSANQSLLRIPELYRAALIRKWDRVITRTSTHPREAEYIHPSDGLTALHLAIISRVSSDDKGNSTGLPAGVPGGGNSNRRRARSSDDASTTSSSSGGDAAGRNPAPIDAIRALLAAWPDAVAVRCSYNSYTPLAYACLVPKPTRALRGGDEDKGGGGKLEKADSGKGSKGSSKGSKESSGSKSSKNKKKLDKRIFRDRNEKDDNSSVDEDKETLKVTHRRRTHRPDHKATVYSNVFHYDETPDASKTSDTASENRASVRNKIEHRHTLESAEEIVRLFLEYRRDAASILTRGGLTALDVHVVSFSQNGGMPPFTMPSKEKTQPLSMASEGGRTTGVLRALLEADPDLAHSREMEEGYNSGTRTAGPLELLYRCNAQCFLTAVNKLEGLGKSSQITRKAWFEKDKKGADDADNSSSLSGPRVCLSILSAWWVWKWMTVILKYGTVHHKKRGVSFYAVHAAATVTGCPLPILMLTVRAFPDQVAEAAGYMKGQEGNLPLHTVSSWGMNGENSIFGWGDDEMGANSVTTSRKGMAICALLSEYPKAAKIKNEHGKTPLMLALESGTGWECGVRRLAKAYTNAVSTVDERTGLYPFMTAAAAGVEDRESDLENTFCGGTGQEQKSSKSLDGKRVDDDKLPSTSPKSLGRLRTIFELLRLDPSVMNRVIKDSKKKAPWIDFSESVSSKEFQGFVF